MIERARISFKSGGLAGRAECVGYLFSPGEVAQKRPCVILGHGFGGTQQGTLEENAEDFAKAGFVALTFDYRSFGESGGEPRQVINIKNQHKDWAAAIAFARSLTHVDENKIALWGSSLGGGHVLAVAAADKKVAAVISQVPFTFGFPKNTGQERNPHAWRIFRRALRDWLRGKLGRAPLYMPAVGKQGDFAIMASETAWKMIGVMQNETWRNEIAPRAIIDMAFFYRPGRQARNIRCPVLLSLAEHDREVPVSMARKVCEQAPFGEMRRYPCTHFDFYNPQVRPHVMADQISFLRTHLTGFDLG